MEIKIKNISAWAAFWIPMLSILLQHYSFWGMITFLGCFGILLLIDLHHLPSNMVHGASVLHRFGWGFFLSQIAFIGIWLFYDFKPYRLKIYHMPSLIVADYFFLALMIVGLIIGYKRKSYVASRIWCYTTSGVFFGFLCWRINGSITAMFWVGAVLLIYLLLDILDVSSRVNAFQEDSFRNVASYHLPLFWISGFLLLAKLLLYPNRILSNQEKMRALLSYFDSTFFILAMVCSLIMVAICAVFRSRKILNTAESSWYLSCAVISLIFYLAQDNIGRYAIILLLYIFFSLLFAFRHGRGKLALTIQEKTEFPLLTINLFFSLFFLIAALGIRLEVPRTGYIMLCLLIVAFLAAGYSSKWKISIISHGILCVLYAAWIGMALDYAWEITQLQWIVLIGFFFCQNILLLTVDSQLKYRYLMYHTEEPEKEEAEILVDTTDCENTDEVETAFEDSESESDSPQESKANEEDLQWMQEYAFGWAKGKKQFLWMTWIMISLNWTFALLIVLRFAH